MSDEKNQTIRFQVLLTPADVELLQNWQTENGVKSRGQAIRTLIELGVCSESAIKSKDGEIRELIKKHQKALSDFKVMVSGVLVKQMMLGKQLPADLDEVLSSAQEIENIKLKNYILATQDYAKDLEKYMEEIREAVNLQASYLEAERKNSD